MMLSLLIENKVASVGAAAIVTGVVLLLSASAVDTDSDGENQAANIKKKNALLASGGSILSIGILAQVYDQYTRRSSSGRSLSSSQYQSSSEMSPAELSRFQDRVSKAAAKLRRSIAESSTPPSPSMSLNSETGESAAELAARASAQISSFIQNYS